MNSPAMCFVQKRVLAVRDFVVGSGKWQPESSASVLHWFASDKGWSNVPGHDFDDEEDALYLPSVLC